MPSAKDVLSDGLERYYTRYYRDQLGLPDWQIHVARRSNEELIERQRFQKAVSRTGPCAGKRFLNVGCGTGGVNAVAQDVEMESYGIDLSRDAIEICRLKWIARGLPEDRFTVGQAEALPYPSNHFDFVYCFSVLEHVQDIRRTLEEMVRVTKPGGVIYINVPNYWTWYEGHYKLFWIPMFPKPLARLYLRLRGRPTLFLESLNYTTPNGLQRMLRSLPVSVDASRHSLSWQGSIKRFVRTLFFVVARVNPGEMWVKKLVLAESVQKDTVSATTTQG